MTPAPLMAWCEDVTFATVDPGLPTRAPEVPPAQKGHSSQTQRLRTAVLVRKTDQG